MSGMHALHKILASHAHPRRASVAAGEFLELEPDVFAVSVTYNAENVARLEQDLNDLQIRELPLKDRIFAFHDHAAPAPSPAIAHGQKCYRDFFRSRGIAMADAGAGISHLIMTEQGVVVPGTVIALKDSHTQTMGAVGAFAASLAGGMLSLYAIGRYWLDVHEVLRIRIAGRLRKGVYGRDVSLHINSVLGQRGAPGHAVEFAGPYVEDLGMDMRFTLCNMGTEIGAMTSYIQPDQTTLDWVKGRTKKAFSVFETDADFVYRDIREFDVSALEPQVAAPHTPDNVRPVTAFEGRHIDQAYLGSCASGRLEDIATAANILRGRRVHPDVRFIVTPGSRDVMNAAIRLGYIEILNDANAIITSASCGACPGTSGGVLAPGETAISCNTRNFNGRMGPNAEIYLASPATVAASAVAGRITSPCRYL
jgi:3-isopropylmalate dehydratase large subunit